MQIIAHENLVALFFGDAILNYYFLNIETVEIP